MPTKDQTILLTLFQHGEMTFRALQKATSVSPRILRVHLDHLIVGKLVRERGRQGRKQGQKLWYTITSTGEKHAAKVALEDIVSATTTMETMVNAIAEEPQKISELRKALEQQSLSYAEESAKKIKMMDRNPTMEETVALFEKGNKIGALARSLKNLYHIYLDVALSNAFRSDSRSGYKEGFVMGITKEGGIYLIPVASLKKHGLGVGL